MKKKLLTMITILMFSLSLIPLAFADGDDYTECPEEAYDVCTDVVELVCGDDNNEYSNGCYACMNEGVTKYQDGECEEEEDTYGTLGDSCEDDSNCDEEQTCVNDVCSISYGDDGLEDEEAECTTNDDCEGDSTCIEGGCKDSEDEEAECTTNDDCEGDSTCVLGECEDLKNEEDEEAECTTDDECEDGKTCILGDCEDNETDDEEYNEVEEEEEEEISEEDEEIVDEAVTMSYSLGAKVRLYQLEFAITKAIIAGDIVIDYLAEEDTTRLSEILDELSEILSEVQTLRDFEEMPDDAVEQFVDSKKLSIELVKEFRDIARDLVDEEDAKELRQLVKDADYSALDELKEEKRTAIREHNADRFKKILEHMGENNPELTEKIKNGEIDAEQAREAIKRGFQLLREGKLKEALENAKQAREEAKTAMEEAKRIFEENKEQRKLKREDIKVRAEINKEKNKEMREQFKTMKEQREKMDEQREKMDERREKVNEQRDNFIDRAKERRANAENGGEQE